MSPLLLFYMIIGAHAHLGHLQSDLSGGQGAGDPNQVQCFERNQDKADVGRKVFGTLWVHEVVRGVAAGVVLVAHSGGQIDPGGDRGWGPHQERFQGCLMALATDTSLICSDLLDLSGFQYNRQLLM